MVLPFDSRAPIEKALTLLGKHLAARGVSCAYVVAGGAAIAMMDRLARTTADVDVLCERMEDARLVAAHDPLSTAVRECAAEVATDLGLPANWFNSQMANGYSAGLPDGFAARVHWRRYDALEIGFLHRVDLIALKLEAASDHVQPGDAFRVVSRERRHLDDLISLEATADELKNAADWVRAANVAPDLDERLAKVIRHVEAQRPE